MRLRDIRITIHPCTTDVGIVEGGGSAHRNIGVVQRKVESADARTKDATPPAIVTRFHMPFSANVHSPL